MGGLKVAHQVRVGSLRRFNRKYVEFSHSLGVALPQEPSTPLPVFEVASVRLTQHGRTPDGWSHSSLRVSSPGTFIATNASYAECIRWAYQVKDYQVIGPDWLPSDEASYDIVAKAPPDTAMTRSG
jgi:hypothetical protein